MMLKKLLFFLGFLQAVIGQQRRIFVDTVSCSNRRTFVAIEESYHSAIRRAGLAIEALRPWAEGGAPINTFDGRIRNVFDLLFGAQNTRGNLLLVFSHLDRLPGIQYMGGDSTSRTMHDIPHNHPKEPNIHNWDTVQKRDFTRLVAGAGMKTPPRSSPFSPSKLYLTAALHGFPGNDVAFGGVRINQASVKAAANPRMHRWLFTHFGGWFERLRVTQIDLLDRLESSMLHELTHTTAGRLADDIELPNSYGWENCRRLQTHRNAALFALAVELINQYHYDVNAAGELTKFE
ncbi:uncharacterized protein NECHADRAFT_82052 [Fusarium vanettenii 77-13-4]|uniref:Lysine-specific metallo-endopeptidase domain-containing protein n=1 Tax=Fusarium vanettenii (strain ATCC MYA-4622 / CBS 123669 / FGSC 9596 / NRRL 45880 / 77-13-4) TaxID=660122 RepID=C7ZAC6_FUSV7|nr:uncharacterized protein NECHADRAFT_82052 [Fusarium vanettenii 77-13-4]EEU39654.1 predicted protein [Fusarium vanettenii 77-13-4]